MLTLCSLRSFAQFVQGTVSDSNTGETLPGVHVYYQDDKKTLVTTNINGRYKIAYRKGKLLFSMMGYDSQIISTTAPQKLNVKLSESSSSLKEVEIVTKKKKQLQMNNQRARVK